MHGWRDVEQQAPELAARAREFLAATQHKTLATLRRDGSPRISGIEADFRDGELWLGCMWQSLKALDLRRDPRFALHSGSVDPPAWRGDAKVAGRAVEVGTRHWSRRSTGPISRSRTCSAPTSRRWSWSPSASPPTTWWWRAGTRAAA